MSAKVTTKEKHDKSVVLLYSWRRKQQVKIYHQLFVIAIVIMYDDETYIPIDMI